ncbi:hypothetical protein CULT_340008 [[Clostridium] ultunense Esp]|uniref:Uncharacterized protein n=1 Tax=[Clostridium] ultunense Esp TaxID=1288971 RepID=M1YZE8_9FIRM|nr:hypothetical protein [Schnuerera ultunensis]CCQ95965.1 hypothetical protein CULT_340008 [[Clostridium] ultunense Esp]SHD77197.1 conserved protein of unknown function [[Clostridium] ultunense Esp]
MNIIVHLPKTKEDYKKLEEIITEMHSEFIINQINNLPCSCKDKVEILEAIIRKVEKEFY